MKTFTVVGVYASAIKIKAESISLDDNIVRLIAGGVTVAVFSLTEIKGIYATENYEK